MRTKIPAGLKYVSRLFVALGACVLLAEGLALFGHTTGYVDVPRTPPSPAWIILWSCVACLLIISGRGILSGHRTAWWIAITLNVLLFGSVLLLPLLIPSLIILLKKPTRDFVKQHGDTNNNLEHISDSANAV
jgi:hypothetical protein